MKHLSKGTKNHTKNKKKNKKKYKVTNWSDYNKALINRGSLTVWINEDVKTNWSGKGRYTYSDQCIETILTVKALYHLPLRASIGLVRSIFDQTGIILDVPDYTTVARRARKLSITLKKTNKPITDMILDSTGAKVYGEGEWKVRKHGVGKRRTWKKLHIGIDSNGEVRAVEVTESDTHDCSAIDSILKQEEAQITDFYGDGAYDTLGIYSLLQAKGVSGYHIPPQVNAKIQIHGNTKGVPYPRDVNLRAIRKSTRKRWKQDSGYHTRSLGENVMFRYKTIFGEHLSFRTHASQTNEVLIKVNLLNAFLALGMPQSVVT
jgi:hypothetical protein